MEESDGGHMAGGGLRNHHTVHSHTGRPILAVRSISAVKLNYKLRTKLIINDCFKTKV